MQQCVIPIKFFQPITATDWSLQYPAFNNHILPKTMGMQLPPERGTIREAKWRGKERGTAFLSGQCASMCPEGAAPYYTSSSQFLDPHSVFYLYAKR